jgi:hypothetical protein
MSAFNRDNATSHTTWCRSIFEKLADDGLWGVPRTGMVFRKNETAKTLVWVGSFPPERDFGLPAGLARATEYLVTRDAFAKAGISVEVSRPLMDYANFKEAEADQKKKVMVKAVIQ